MRLLGPGPGLFHQPLCLFLISRIFLCLSCSIFRPSIIHHPSSSIHQSSSFKPQNLLIPSSSVKPASPSITSYYETNRAMSDFLPVLTTWSHFVYDIKQAISVLLVLLGFMALCRFFPQHIVHYTVLGLIGLVTLGYAWGMARDELRHWQYSQSGMFTFFGSSFLRCYICVIHALL